MANEEESDKTMAKEHSWPMQLLEPRLRGGQVCGRLGNLDQRVTGSGKGGWETLFSSLVCCPLSIFWRDFLVAQPVKNLPAMQKTQVQFLGLEDPLKKEMATLSSILA